MQGSEPWVDYSPPPPCEIIVPVKRSRISSLVLASIFLCVVAGSGDVVTFLVRDGRGSLGGKVPASSISMIDMYVSNDG